MAGGAQALNRAVGALAPGYRADIVTLDAAAPDLACVSGDRLLDAYVFVAGKAAIRDVWVAGQEVVTTRRHHAHDAIVARYARCLTRLLNAA